ncbi:helix-turn-helix domain-containing protein [Pseudomonas sp. NIBR-H-19]|uniref:helix-turn-helix domain-containing protein n=1 Tax=Pseudomonas sp. NIBR-H-19 TaxID=2901380 RepID=UPI002FCC8732
MDRTRSKGRCSLSIRTIEAVQELDIAQPPNTIHSQRKRGAISNPTGHIRPQSPTSHRTAP